MIGNDVVDLADPEARPGRAHPRFDARVFSPPERHAIAESPEPVRERWLRWAAKEAAYKCLRARDRTVCFSPVELVVDRRGPTGADVRWRDRVLSVRLDLEDDRVHAVAWDAPGSPGARTVSAVRRVGDSDPRAAVRRLAVRELADALGESVDALRIEKGEDRVPVLRCRSRRLDASLSLSHHGRFVGFACELGPGARWSP